MWIFNPILKTTIWGGSRIIPFKQLNPADHENPDSIGESWEISGVEGSESVVADGPESCQTLTQLIETYGETLLGHRNYIKYGSRFPLLVKFIDACRDLSVQVHPDDDLARERGHANGKNEMWYVLHADKGARLANGFAEPVDPSEYDHLVSSGEIEQKLRYNAISEGEVYYIPAGRVHAIGAGSFILEIQQTSDVTYRLYDYRRKDANGRERELHTDLAFDAIRFDDTEGKAEEYTNLADLPVNMVSSPYFTANLLNITRPLLRDYSEWDTFVCIVAIEGKAEIRCGDRHTILPAGHTILIPASAQGIHIIPDNLFRAVETYIR